MDLNLDDFPSHEPLVDYPWKSEIDHLLIWMEDKGAATRAFVFDLIMSAAYIEATAGLEKLIEKCDAIEGDYNTHVGFINLCSSCYIYQDVWSYQKAAKPQSGALGKLSSEVILRFIEKLYPQLSEVRAIGGTESADAVLRHRKGFTILAEVKSAPLLTYPFLFDVPVSCLNGHHEKVVMTASQLRATKSAILLHGVGHIDLGNTGQELWPFKPLVDFIIDEKNTSFVQQGVSQWFEARKAYVSKDRHHKMYYLTNASGQPPKRARDKGQWPRGVSISDSKTSAGMDRTDDIKKGIYQSLKIGAYSHGNPNIKTAIISNLPAYRHGHEYVDPFVDMFWGLEKDMHTKEGQRFLLEKDLRRVFDFIITLDEHMMRGVAL